MFTANVIGFIFPCKSLYVSAYGVLDAMRTSLSHWSLDIYYVPVVCNEVKHTWINLNQLLHLTQIKRVFISSLSYHCAPFIRNNFDFF